MSDLHLKCTECGDWITNWMGRDHHVTLGTVDQTTFVSMGLIGVPPVRFEITPLGEILSIRDNRTNEPLTEITIPNNHFLKRDVVIGKPFKETYVQHESTQQPA